MERDLTSIAAGLATLLAKQRAARATLAMTERHKAAREGRVPWWTANLPAPPPTPTSEEKAQLEKQVEEAQRAHDEIAAELAEIRKASERAPALELAWRVVDIVGSLSKTDLFAGGELERSLENVCTFIVDTWLPGFEPDTAVASLLDERTRASLAARSYGPLQPHSALFYLPIDFAELLGRAARALSSVELAKARANLRREEAEFELAASARRAHLRRLVETRARPDSDVGLTMADRELAREGEELSAATERLHDLVVDALGTFPPMRVFAAAAAARSALGVEPGIAELAFGPAGTVILRTSAWRRIIVLHSIDALCDAVDEAFDGLHSVLSGRQITAVSGAVYRSASDEEPRTEPSAAEARLFSVLDQARMAGRLKLALAHTEMLGLVSACRRSSERRIGLFDRLRVWSESMEEASTTALAARERWHLDVLRAAGEEALSITSRAACVFPVLALRNAIFSASFTIRCLHASQDLRVGRLVRVHDAVNAVQAIVPLAFNLGIAGGLDLVVQRTIEIRERHDFIVTRALRHVGTGVALAELSRWTAAVLAALGPIPSDGELLELYARHRLDPDG